MSYVTKIFKAEEKKIAKRTTRDKPAWTLSGAVNLLTIRYGKHTLRYQGPYIWSKLENGMRELPSLSIFKTKIRRVDLASLVEDSGNCCNLCST